MISLETPLKCDELEQVAGDIYRQSIEPHLQPADVGKLVAIDAESGDHEIDSDDFTAVARLLARHPKAQIWLIRVGEPAVFRFR